MPLLFGDKVEYRFLGRKYGDFHPAHEGSDGLRQRVMNEMELGALFLPSLKFTNQVANFFDSNSVELGAGLWRTCQKADAGIVTGDPHVGIAICNADCHVGILYNPHRRMLCVMHLGLKCFFRSDEISILQEAVRVMQNDPEDLQFWFGAGIGACCNGYDVNDPKWGENNQRQANELRARFGDGTVHGDVMHGPRKGQLAHDIRPMICAHGYDLGLANISGLKCSSCAGMEDPDADGFGTYWSNVRDLEKRAYRNMFVARLVP